MPGTRHLRKRRGVANSYLESCRLKFSKEMFNRELATHLNAFPLRQGLGFSHMGNYVPTGSAENIFPHSWKYQVKFLSGPVNCEEKGCSDLEICAYTIADVLMNLGSSFL